MAGTCLPPRRIPSGARQTDSAPRHDMPLLHGAPAGAGRAGGRTFLATHDRTDLTCVSSAIDRDDCGVKPRRTAALGTGDPLPLIPFSQMTAVRKTGLVPVNGVASAQRALD
jgi:hypothetical protein